MSPHVQALKYDQWLQEARRGEGDAAARYSALAQNAWAELVGGHLTDALRRGPGCFDQAFYVGANRFDLGYIEVSFPEYNPDIGMDPDPTSNCIDDPYSNPNP